MLSLQAYWLGSSCDEHSVLTSFTSSLVSHRKQALSPLIITEREACRGNLGPDPKEESSLREVLDKVDCKQDLSHFQASASAAVSTSKELAERQEQALEAASQELLCSPDIIRYCFAVSCAVPTPFLAYFIQFSRTNTTTDMSKDLVDQESA